jgi:hypothetical protein
VTGSSRVRVVRRPAEQLALGPGAGYIWSGGQILALTLGGGSERTLVRMGQAQHIVPSPSGERLAVQGLDGRLRLVDLASGAVRTRALREAWAFAWLGADRLMARIGEVAVVLDGSLRRQRRYEFPEVFGQAPLDDAVFGLNRYRLVRLDLESGRTRAASRLPDRGIAELVGVVDGPEVDLPRRPPRLTPAGASGAARCGTAPWRRPRPGAPGSR